MRPKNTNRANRALDKRVAEMYDDLGYITREGDEFYGWDHDPFDPRYSPYTYTCFGLIPRYSADADAVKLIEQKIEAANCLDEYVRDLEMMGVNLETATPSHRCRAATRIHPVYALKVEERKQSAPEIVREEKEPDETYKQNEARAAEFMAGIEARLIKLVENRAFRFVDTHRELAEAYLRPMLTFNGLPEEYVARLDEMRGGLPHMYRAYVRRFGIERGLLYSESKADPFAVKWYQASAKELLKGSGHESILDADPNIFLFDRDDLFFYFKDGDASAFDAPVYRYIEGKEPKQIAAGFAELLEDELARMEKNSREERETGGYFITLGGGMRNRVYPAFNEGHNPVDVEDQFI